MPQIKTNHYASYTKEFKDDLKSLTGFDGEAELMNILEHELEENLSRLPERPIIIDKFLISCNEEIPSNNPTFTVSYSYVE